MKRHYTTLGIALACAASVLASPPVIDGRANDVLYGDALATQDTQTGYGDANLGRPDICNGSEIDHLYGVVYDGYLYLVFAGNFETNGNRLEIFFDSVPGGQNTLSPHNPIDYGTLGPKGPGIDPNGPGLTFQYGFEADYYLSVNAYGNPVDLYVDYARLYVGPGDPGAAYYLGKGQASCTTSGGALAPPPDPNVPTGVFCTVDNSNIRGVIGGFDWGWIDPNSPVRTGIELAIPLARLGNPSGDIDVTAFVGDNAGQYASNQVMGGLAAAFPGNLADSNYGYTYHIRQVNLSDFPDHGPVTITNPPAPAIGACCVGMSCQITTEAACTGIYLGDNVSCDGNPCDPVPGGRCCLDDGYSGMCLIVTQAECEALPGYVSWDPDSLSCEGCPCLVPIRGACCVVDPLDPNARICELRTAADCVADPNNAYLGDFTTCDDPNACAVGACCMENTCFLTTRHWCWNQPEFGLFFGAGTTCLEVNCSLSTPHLAGEWQGWNPADPNWAMIEDANAPGIFHKLVVADPNMRYEFKITNGQDWEGAIPGANCWLYTDLNGQCVVTYDSTVNNDGWLPDWPRIGESVVNTWNATGDFQSELGGGDWNNGDPNFLMTETPDGSGTFLFETDQLPVASYQWKPVTSGTWDSISTDSRSIFTKNIPFDISVAGDTVRMSVDARNGRVMTEVIPANPTLCPGDANCDGFINFRDIDYFVTAQNDNVAAWSALFGGNPPCNFLNNDTNGDTYVNFRDIDPFVVLQNTTCP